MRGQYLQATSIFAGLGLLALLIAAIGLYAVVAFAVSQRLAEIAVRLAIGARAGQVVLRTMGDGLRLVLVGLVLGLPASLAGLALVTGTTNMLPPVSLWQVGSLAMLGIATIAALATWIPARRAARVDPANYLRGD
jgi:ABC-type antimicrobial peptide transport system permease subunit